MISLSEAEAFANDDHIPKEFKAFSGDTFFASTRALQGYTTSRRDDLESLGYSILYLMNPRVIDVPWSHIDRKNYQKILEIKCKFLKIQGRSEILNEETPGGDEEVKEAP